MHHLALTALLERELFISPPVPWELILADLEDLAHGEGGDQMPVHEALSPAKLEILVQQTGFTAEQIEGISAFDPTPNGACTGWLVRQVKAGTLHLPEDGDVRDNLTAYLQIKAKAAYDGEKDLNKLEPGDLWDIVQRYHGLQGKKEKARSAAMEGVKSLGQAGVYEVFEVTTPEAGAALWRQTNWCVRASNMFNNYGPPYFYVTKDGAPFLLYHEKSKQLKTPNDKEAPLKTVYPAFEALKASGILLDQKTALRSFMGAGERNRVFTTLSMLQFVRPEELESYLQDLGLIAGAPVEFRFTKKSMQAMGAENWFKALIECKEFIPVNAASVRGLWGVKGFVEKFTAMMNAVTDAEWMTRFWRSLPMREADLLVPVFKPNVIRLMPASLPLALSSIYTLAESERWPEIEPFILADRKSCEIATEHHSLTGLAGYVINYVVPSKTRWPEFEAAFPGIILNTVQSPDQVAASVGAGFRYAVEVLKARWPGLEQVVDQRPKVPFTIFNLGGDSGHNMAAPYLTVYMNEVGSMWPAAEKATLRRPEQNLAHLEKNLKGPYAAGREALVRRAAGLVADPKTGDDTLKRIFEVGAELKIKAIIPHIRTWVERTPLNTKKFNDALEFISKNRDFLFHELRDLFVTYCIPLSTWYHADKVMWPVRDEVMPVVLDILYGRLKVPNTIRSEILYHTLSKWDTSTDTTGPDSGLLKPSSFSASVPSWKKDWVSTVFQSNPEWKKAAAVWRKERGY